MKMVVTHVLFQADFSTVTAIELAMANIWYLQFARPERPNVKALFQVLGILYRPAGEPYETPRAEARAAAFERLPYGLVIALIQYFEHVNAVFLKQYESVLQGDGNEAPLFLNGEGWISLLEDVGQTGVYGTTEQVFQANAHTVFGYLRRTQIKVRDMERRAEREG